MPLLRKRLRRKRQRRWRLHHTLRPRKRLRHRLLHHMGCRLLGRRVWGFECDPWSLSFDSEVRFWFAFADPLRDASLRGLHRFR